METFLSINYWSVLVAGIVYFIIGAVWYSPLLFSKRWVKEIGINTDKNQQSFPIMPMLGQLLSSFLFAFGIAFVLQLSGCRCLPSAILVSITTILFFVLPIHSGTLFFKNKPVLFAIEAGYQAVGTIAICSILCLYFWK